MLASPRSPLHPLAEALVDFRRTFWPIMPVGILGGLVGFVYLFALHHLEHWIGPHRWSVWPQVGVLAAIGLAVGLITRFLGTPGDVELLVDNIHVLGGGKDLRDLRSLLPVSLLCIAAGGAAGPEAPLVQTTGSLGTWLANRAGASVHDRRVWTITGMAAGFTVLFGAPLGAAIFALEILHRRGMEYYEALMPAVVGSLCGYVIYVVATGLGLTPVWQFPAAELHTVDLAWAVVAGVVGAAVAVAFTYVNAGLRRAFHLLPPTARPVVGGTLLGLLAAASPFALTFGEEQINGLAGASPTTAHAAIAFFALAALIKFAGTSVTISSGWRGGFIIPLFFIGVALARLTHVWVPHTNEVVLMAAMMVAVNTGVTKTPLGSTLVVTKMAGLQLLPTTLVAAVVTLLLTSQVGLIHSQRERDSATNGEGASGPEALAHDEVGDRVLKA